jgi:hypothetical protein
VRRIKKRSGEHAAEASKARSEFWKKAVPFTMCMCPRKGANRAQPCQCLMPQRAPDRYAEGAKPKDSERGCGMCQSGVHVVLLDQ